MPESNRDEPLDAAVSRLREIGRQRPTPERRAEVRNALSDRREGVQAVAAQVLGAWGGRETVENLRAWLQQLDQRHPSYSGPRNVAIRELARCINAADADWALDLYFGQDTLVATHEYLPLGSATEPEKARRRIKLELRNQDPIKRHAALKLIRWMQLPDGADLAQPLLDDPDHTTRRLARDLVESA